MRSKTHCASLVSEFFGTAVLFIAVIGSGIMAETLSPDNAAVALLANTFATVWILYVLIEICSPHSGAQFNPCVSVLNWARGEQSIKNCVQKILAQTLGAFAAAPIAHLMFNQKLFQVASNNRLGFHLYVAEYIACLGLLVIIMVNQNREKSATIISSYIGAAYWFTSSTSFANPAAVLARMWSDTFAGISPISAVGAIGAQLFALATAILIVKVWQLRTY